MENNMREDLFVLASSAKRKPNFLLASFISIVMVIIGSMFGIFGYFLDLKDYIRLAVFDLGIGFAGAILMCFLYVRVIEKRSISSMGFHKSGAVKIYIKGFLIGAAMFAAIVLVGTVSGAYTISIGISSISALLPVLIVLCGFLIQGASEEVVYRGWLLPILGARYSKIFAIIVSSLIFAALHAMNPGMTIMPVINLILFGVFASVYAIGEKSLWGICGFHSAWNWVQGSFFGIKVSGTSTPGGSILNSTPTEGMSLISGGNFGIEGSILCSVAFIIGIIFIVKKMEK